MDDELFRFSQTKRCRVKREWEHAGKQGECYGYFFCLQKWAIVCWDGDEDPDVIKAGALEIQKITWESMI